MSAMASSLARSQLCSRTLLGLQHVLCASKSTSAAPREPASEESPKPFSDMPGVFILLEHF